MKVLSEKEKAKEKEKESMGEDRDGVSERTREDEKERERGKKRKRDSSSRYSLFLPFTVFLSLHTPFLSRHLNIECLAHRAPTLK